MHYGAIGGQKKRKMAIERKGLLRKAIGKDDFDTSWCRKGSDMFGNYIAFDV